MVGISRAAAHRPQTFSRLRIWWTDSKKLRGKLLTGCLARRKWKIGYEASVWGLGSVVLPAIHMMFPWSKDTQEITILHEWFNHITTKMVGWVVRIPFGRDGGIQVTFSWVDPCTTMTGGDWPLGVACSVMIVVLLVALRHPATLHALTVTVYRLYGVRPPTTATSNPSSPSNSLTTLVIPSEETAVTT